MPDAGPILVIDDDAEVRDYLALALASFGRPVVAAEDLALERPALALVDLVLGTADGLPLIERLLAAGVPVVAISGLAAEAPPVAAARAAGAVVLGKPFGLQELRDTVAALLPGHRAP